MENKTELTKIIEDIKTYEDDPEELSKLLIVLSAQLFWAGSKLAKSQLRYSETIVKRLTVKEKTSVAQAEREADVITGCEHDELRYEKDAILEMMNSLKARLKVLAGEYKNSDN